MKKFLALLLVLVMSLTIVSCSILPESVRDGIDSIKNQIFGQDDSDDSNVHEHSFYVVGGRTPTCVKGGYSRYACACGETKREELDPLGHSWSEFVEESRIVVCTVKGCNAKELPGYDPIHAESLTFNFTAEHEAEITAKYNEVLAAIDAAPEYDPDLHGYAEEGELKEAYDAVDALHTELYDLVLYAVAQRQIAEIDYYCDMENTELEERYSYMMDYYTELMSTFYSLSQPFYDSCYRDFYYYGMTEPEIKSYLFEANALSNEEYAALTNRNSEIELEVIGILNPTVSDDILELYEEFVANNKRIAEILGYKTYLDYAYENMYSRDYTYQDVAVITDFVKTYLAPAFCKIYERWNSLASSPLLSKEDINHYYDQVSYSFFENQNGNRILNDYIDTLVFTSNPDKQISFSDELNGLASHGNLFRGDYEGAFVTDLSAFDLPIAYFGPGYDTPFTVAHEFGHYMNEIYNSDVGSQSYDILEMHSQGNELLYLSFIEPYVTENGYDLVETYQLLNMLYTIMASLAVDCFEQAVYLDYYDGPNSAEIMADGKITANEYDLLYRSIIEDFGTSKYQESDYWRYGMTVTSPCYYVSYSVSAISVLQLYEIANSDSQDAAVEAYLKLFTYADENPDMTTAEVLRFAGLYSFTDEELYKAISDMLKSL